MFYSGATAVVLIEALTVRISLLFGPPTNCSWAGPVLAKPKTEEKQRDIFMYVGQIRAV